MSIRENTTSLEEILATVNALPDAGSSGGSITFENGETTVAGNSYQFSIPYGTPSLEGAIALRLSVKVPTPLATSSVVQEVFIDLVNSKIGFSWVAYNSSTQALTASTIAPAEGGSGVTITVDESAGTVSFQSAIGFMVVASTAMSGTWRYTAIYNK